MMWSKVSMVFLSVLLLTVGCGKKVATNDLSETISLETIFVKGDPLALIEGSHNNSQSFITSSNLDNFNEYSLASITQYTEKAEVIQKEDTESAETGNEAVEEDMTSNGKSNFYSFRKDGNEFVYSSSKSKLEFSFVEKFGRMDLISLQLEGEVYDLKTIHYSLKNTIDAFSILAEISDSDVGRILLAFTFTKKSEAKEIEKTSTYFKYLYGAGVKVLWDQQEVLQVNICGRQSPAVERAYRRGMAQWNEALQRRLTIVSKTLFVYPPFSDLNTHCIYTVKNYQTIPGNHFINMASTITKGDMFKGEIIDSDIMIWVKENEKFGTSLEETQSLQSTTAHEFGHLLGLHHQFDKSLDSIMGYDGIENLTAYDEEAIAALYSKY